MAPLLVLVIIKVGGSSETTKRNILEAAGMFRKAFFNMNTLISKLILIGLFIYLQYVYFSVYCLCSVITERHF